MPSMQQSGQSAADREEFPEVAEVIGEDPARFLDKPLAPDYRSGGSTTPMALAKARIDGIDSLVVVARWLEVEHQLDRGPRDSVVERPEQRGRELKEHGERVLPNLSPEDVFVSGSPGSGKTTTSKFVARQLEKQTFGSDLRPEGHPPSLYRDHIREADQFLVAIVDECNTLCDPETLMDLHRLPNVSLILVCVDEDDFYASAHSRLLSRLRGAVKVHLERYEQSQLRDILAKRVEHGLVLVGLLFACAHVSHVW